MEKVISSIKAALEKNGFPDKRVRLPFQPVFKTCKNHGTTLSAVLNELKEQDIRHEMDNDRILFYHKDQPPLKKPEPASQDEGASGGIPDDVYAEAMEKIKSMDPAEVERIKEQVMNMSPEERDNLMKQAQDMFQKKKSN